MDEEPLEQEPTITWTEAHFRALLESAPDATVICDEDGCILLVNRQLERLFGHPRGELLGRPIELLVPEAHRGRHVELRRRYVESPTFRPMGGEKRLTAVRRDGTEFPVEISLSPIRTRDGTLVAAAIRDATERVRVERELRRAREGLEREVGERTAELLAQSGEMAARAHRQKEISALGKRIIATRDLDAIIEDAASLLARVLEVEFVKVLEILPGEDGLLLRSGIGWDDGVVGRATVGANEESQAGFTLLSDGPVVVHDLRSEDRFRGPPLLLGHGVRSGMSVVIHGDREPFGVLGAHSRTLRTFSDDDVQFLQSVANLVGEAIERNRAETALIAAQRVAQEKERLADVGAIVAKIVHDCGNTVAGLSMMAQQLERRARASNAGDDIEDAARMVLDQSRQLERMVREFREFSREQRLELETIELPRMLEGVIRLWRGLATERQVELGLALDDAAPPVRADEGKLRRVVDNLIKNALEAIDEGPGRVTLSVDAPRPDRVRLSIEDTGAGLPDSIDVFELFETTKEEGSGLGLAICRQIMTAHGGTISHRPASPKGTVFEVVLPVNGPPGT